MKAVNDVDNLRPQALGQNKQSKRNGVKEKVVERKQGDQKGQKAWWEEKEKVFIAPLCCTEMLQGWYSQQAKAMTKSHRITELNSLVKTFEPSPGWEPSAPLRTLVFLHYMPLFFSNFPL